MHSCISLYLQVDYICIFSIAWIILLITHFIKCLGDNTETFEQLCLVGIVDHHCL